MLFAYLYTCTFTDSLVNIVTGPLPLTSDGNRYILTMTDYFTKFVDLFALPDKTAQGVSRSIKTFVTR